MSTLQDVSDDIFQEITSIVFDYPCPPVQPCDLIFVFGGSHPGLWQTAAQAFHRGLGKTILATGGCKPGVRHHRTWVDGSTPESLVIRRELIKLSVPEDRIIWEEKSTSSLENVLFAKEVYDFSKIASILAVCKNYGVGRQCRTLRQHVDKSVKVIPYPFDTEAGNGPFITRHTWMNYEESRTVVFTQAVKIVQYGKLGHLEPVEHISPVLENLLEKFNAENRTLSAK